jgi:arylsulfatase A-like enzyme
MSLLGHPNARTPQLDALAADGVIFADHWSQCAPCSPARASLLTGLYQMNHRVLRNGTPLDARHPTVATEARKVGYDPLQFGYSDQTVDPRTVSPGNPRMATYEGIAPGFAAHTPLPAGGALWRDWLRARGVDVGEDFREVWRPRADRQPPKGVHAEPPAFSSDETETAFLTERVIGHLREREGAAPWFLHVSHLRPHPPFVVPEPYNTMIDPSDVALPVRADSKAAQAAMHPFLAFAMERVALDSFVYEAPGLVADLDDDALRTVRAVYYGMIAEVDAQVGRLMAYLKESGAYHDTLVIVTSDHGELLGDHHLFGKLGWFDGAYRVPLIIKPAAAPMFGRVDVVTEAVDIAPTILEAIGVAKPPAMNGRSLLPFLHGEVPDLWRNAAHWEFDFRETATGDPERALGLPLDACQLAVIRDDRYKYVHFTGLPPLLFDLGRDPQELDDRADDEDYRDIRALYAERMLSWRAAHMERTLTGWDLTAPGGPLHRSPDRGQW